MFNIKSFFKKTIRFLVFTMVMVCITTSIMQTTYSTSSQSNPDLVVTINSDGGITTEGNLFGDDLWYPGKEKSGVIRISNFFKVIDASNISFEVDLKKYNEKYAKEAIYNTFNSMMRLSLSKGKLDIFSQNIVDKVSLGQLVDGFNIEEGKRFTIDKNDFVDLKYTLTMDEEAGNELQGITAVISMLVNVNEKVVPVDPGPPTVNGGESGETVVEKPVPFDIKEHWAKDCILWLIEEGIVGGYEDGTIKPNNYITRAETAALLARALKLEKVEKPYTGYLDSIPLWAKGDIIAVTEQGIFSGFPVEDGRVFMANSLITREQTAAVFIRAFGLCLEEEVELNFIDKDEISGWALEDVKAGVCNGILNGYPDNTFKPKNSITRAEVFSILCRLLKMNGVTIN